MIRSKGSAHEMKRMRRPPENENDETVPPVCGNIKLSKLISTD